MGKSRSVSEQVTGFIKQAEAGTTGASLRRDSRRSGASTLSVARVVATRPRPDPSLMSTRAGACIRANRGAEPLLCSFLAEFVEMQVGSQ